jgi:hypothetical protein
MLFNNEIKYIHKNERFLKNISPINEKYISN